MGAHLPGFIGALVILGLLLGCLLMLIIENTGRPMSNRTTWRSC